MPATSIAVSASAILRALFERSIDIWIEDTRLAWRDAEGVLSPEEIADLKECEPQILAELRKGEYITRTFPLSYGQKSLWSMHQTMAQSSAYHIGLAVRIRSAVHVPALRDSLQALVNRHAALRTVFGIGSDEKLCQRVYAWRTVPFQQTDITGWTEDEVTRSVNEAYRAPFDLSNGPLFRARLFTDGAEHHQLLLTIHHIVFDGTSMFVFLTELQDLYGAAQARSGARAGTGIQAASEFFDSSPGGRPVSLRPLKATYADFVQWQTEMLAGPEGQNEVAWWRQRLLTAPQELDLPTDFPRPTHFTGRGGSLTFEVPPEVIEALRRIAKGSGVHLYEILLAAYHLLLHRYSGQAEILNGFVAAGRPQLRFAKLCGFFINLVVLRSALEGDLPFAAFLRRQHESATESLEHQNVPFLALVDQLQVARVPGRTPLVQTLFNFFKIPRGTQVEELFIAGHGCGPVMSPGLVWEAAALTQDDTEFDLVLEAAEGRRFWCRLKYSAEVFQHERIERLAGHYQNLLKAIARDPNRPLSAMSLLSEDERRQMLVTWNQTQRDYPLDTCIHEYFEAQANRTPDQIAVIFEERRLTYSELNREANRLAHYLRAQGVGPDVLVGVCIERSIEMLVGLLAILKAGGAYVPLDPHFPKTRLDLILASARPALILSQSSLRHLISGSGAQILSLDADRDRYAGGSGDNLPVLSKGTDLAYVLYTSGSTGTPKGVQIPHSAFTNFQLAMKERPGLTAADVLLAVTTISFDIAGLELFLPLMVGARLILTPRERVIDGSALAATIERHGVTVMQATPSTWHLLLDAGWRGTKRLKVLCGGEALTRELANQLLARVGSLWNMYGPTETTVWSSVEEVRPGSEAIPLGAPIANTTFYILDRFHQPVPIGVRGELYIGGDGLARGYLGSPELTDSRFIPDPFRGKPGARMYKTGDGALYRPDGSIQFLGRLDDQVKVRGHRIELGDIESVLLRHRSVREVAVVVRDDGGTRHLVAFLVAAAEAPAADPNELRTYVRGELPDYMVPAAFVFLEALPLTPNNKVDRKTLRSMPIVEPETTTHESAAPQTPTEITLAGIWSKILRVPRIGAEMRFHDLGGDSLAYAQMIFRAREMFRVDLNVETQGDAGSLADLARTIDLARARNQAAAPNDVRSLTVAVPKRSSHGTATVRKRPAHGTASVRERSPNGTATVRERPSNGTATVRDRPSNGTATVRERPRQGSATARQQFPNGTATVRERPEAPRKSWLGSLLLRINKLLAHLVAAIECEGIHNLPRSGPLIVAGNHISFFDFLVYGSVLADIRDEISVPPAFIIAETWRRWVHWFAVQLGNPIYIRRGEGDLDAFGAAVEVLKSGGVVGLMPEGRPTRGALIRCKPGIAYLSDAASALVLPVAISGHDRAFQFWRRLRRVPVRVRFGESFLPAAAVGADATPQQQADSVMRTIARMLPPEYRGEYRDVDVQKAGIA